MDHFAHLFNLVRLSRGAFRLKVQNLRHSWLGKYVMTPANALHKSQGPQDRSQLGKPDISVPVAGANFQEYLPIHLIEYDRDGSEPSRRSYR